MEAIHYEEFYTLEDYRRWEGDWELIEGRPYAMAPAPVKLHQRISLQLAMVLSKALEACEGCEVYQDIDYIVAEDTVVRPDVVVECDAKDEIVARAPEIVFEIVSPSTARRDETAKFALYEREGVPYYGLVYPEFRVVKLYKRSEEGKYLKVGDFKNETIELKTEKCALALDFSALWTK